VDFDNNEFKAIVYEFMANGSLDMWIHPRIHQGTPRRLLSLGQRISIAADVASALDYLHNQLTPPMIHCDLKPGNVLLDYDMTSRVGDFGSAKFLSSCRGTPEGLAGFGGTIGYIAPGKLHLLFFEMVVSNLTLISLFCWFHHYLCASCFTEYGMGCKISTGGDVYSFGVLLLEMLTAVRPTDAQCGNAFSLHKYVGLAFPERIAEVLDPNMPLEEDEVAASLCMQNYIMPLVSIGLMCSMESPKDRPGMHDVCAKIEAIKEAFVETL
jgi:serine/threonine protein kinase